MSFGKRQEPLPNVIRSGSDVEYETMPDGVQPVGLVGIKLVQKKAWQSDEKDDFYRFIFRSRSNPNAFCNHDCKAVWSNRSNLFKTMQNMTECKVKESWSNDHVFNEMQALVGKSFKINVQGRDWTSPEGNTMHFTKVVGNYVMPDPMGPAGDVREWFKLGKKEKIETNAVDVEAEPKIDFSGYEDMETSHKEAEGKVEFDGDDDIPF